jgi:hypothetical protein
MAKWSITGTMALPELGLSGTFRVLLEAETLRQAVEKTEETIPNSKVLTINPQKIISSEGWRD